MVIVFTLMLLVSCITHCMEKEEEHNPLEKVLLQNSCIPFIELERSFVDIAVNDDASYIVCKESNNKKFNIFSYLSSLFLQMTIMKE